MKRRRFVAASAALAIVAGASIVAAQRTQQVTFDQLFPPAAQQSMGLHKLTSAEKARPKAYIEALMTRAMQAGAAENVIETQIDGTSEGWNGDTVWKMTNGQVWQQASIGYHYRYAFRPRVLLYRSGGGWKMRVDGDNDEVVVKRLK